MKYAVAWTLIVGLLVLMLAYAWFGTFEPSSFELDRPQSTNSRGRKAC